MAEFYSFPALVIAAASFEEDTAESADPKDRVMPGSFSIFAP